MSFADARAASAKSRFDEAKMMERDEFIKRPQDLELIFPAFMTEDTVPPCFPTPGTKKKCSGQSARMASRSSGLVPPTTNMELSGVPIFFTRFITC